MAVVVHIGGGLRSVKAGSVQYNRSLREAGTASCEIRGSQGTRVGGEHFRVYESHGQSAWGGTVDQVTVTRLRPGSTEQYYSLTCVSWEHRLMKRFCGSKVYRTENAQDRMLDLLATYGGDEGILANPTDITPSATAEQLGVKSYIGMSLAEAFDDICGVGGDVWFCDPGANLLSKPRNASVASQLIFNNSTQNFFDPVITEDRNDYANRIKLAIAFEAFAPQPYQIVGDGVTREWTLTGGGGAEISIDHVVSAALNGVAFTMENYDQNPDADWSFEYGTGKIRQNPILSVLSPTDTVDIQLYVIGHNIITVEDSEDIAARKLIEDDNAIDASGIYEQWFEDLTINNVEAGQQRAGVLLKERNPHSNGAPAGSLPRKYVFKARGYIPFAYELQPGYTVQFENNSPNTGGNKTLLIETVNAQQTGAVDPVGDPTGGFLLYTVTCIDYVETTTAGDFLLSLGSNVTGGGTSNVTVNGGNGESTVPAGNMTGLSVETRYVVKQGRWVRQLHCKGMRPDPLGSFDSVALYLEEPDLSSGPPANLLGDGSGDWNGVSSISDIGWDPKPQPRLRISADNQTVVIDDLPPATVPIPGRVYFNSVNTAGAENPLVRAYLAGATPSVAYVSNPPSSGTVTGGLGEEYAPTVLSFTADNTEGLQPRYKYQSGGDPLWGASFDVEYRTDDVRHFRLGGVRLVIEYPEGNRENDSSHFLLSKISTRDDHPVRAVGFEVKVYCVSYDLDGNTNTIQSNTPYVSLFIAPPLGPPGEEYSNKVTELELVDNPYYKLNADGQRVLIIPGFFRINGDDPRSASGNIRLIRNGGHSVLFESHDEGFFNGEVVDFPIADEPDTYLYVLTVNTNGWFNSYIDSGPNATPRVGPFTLPAPPLGTAGQERAPKATGLSKRSTGGFVNGVKYNWQVGGDPTYQIAIDWDEVDSATQPQTGGYDVVYEYPDGKIGQVAGISVNDDPEWVSPEYPLTADGSFDVVLVTWDVNGRLNTHATAPRLTFNITRTEQPPLGGSGQEWTANLLTFDAGTPTTPVTDQGGQAAVTRVPLTVTQPDVAGYEGWIAMSISPEGVHVAMSGVIKSDTHMVEFPFVAAANETWTLYGLTQDIGGRRNTYNPSLTPRETVILGPRALGSAGQEYCGLVSTSLFSMQTRTTIDGIGQYRYQITWTPPADNKWGSVSLIEYTQAGFNNFVYSSPKPLATFHKNESGTVYSPWMEQTDAATGEVYKAAAMVSVDVNGRENTFTPGITPLVNNVSVVAGGGALNAKRMGAGTFDPVEFTFDGLGRWSDGNKSAEKMKVGSLLKVGGGPTQKVGQIGVFDDTDVMIGWDGKNGTFTGGWRRNFWIGGSSPLDAPFKSVNGAVSLENVPLTVVLNGVTTKVTNELYGVVGYAGVSVGDTSWRTYIKPDGVTIASVGNEVKSNMTNFGVAVKNSAWIEVDGNTGASYKYREPGGAISTGASGNYAVGGANPARTFIFRGGLFIGVA